MVMIVCYREEIDEFFRRLIVDSRGDFVRVRGGVVFWGIVSF